MQQRWRSGIGEFAGRRRAAQRCGRPIQPLPLHRAPARCRDRALLLPGPHVFAGPRPLSLARPHRPAQRDRGRRHHHPLRPCRRHSDRRTRRQRCAHRPLRPGPRADPGWSVSPQAIEAIVDKHPEADHELCLNHQMSSPVPFYQGGGQLTVGELLHEASLPGGTEARRRASALGLKPVNAALRSYSRGGGLLGVAVANDAQGLARIFADTRWADGVTLPCGTVLATCRERDSQGSGQPSSSGKEHQGDDRKQIRHHHEELVGHIGQSGLQADLRRIRSPEK